MRGRRDRHPCFFFFAASFVAAASLAPGRAAADPPSAEDQALATTLFRDAKALLDGGNVAEACRKLEESQRLYPAGGTLLNLAVCHEKEGKTASAWTEYRQARVIAVRDQRTDRIELVDERIAVVEPKLSRRVVEVAPAVDVPDLEIIVDARVLRRPAWGTAVPVDPGQHVIEAKARGKKSWRTQVTVLPDADLRTVAVPAWEDEVVPPAVTAPVPMVKTAPESPTRSEWSRNRTIAVVGGIAGVAGIGVGTFFGVRAIDKHDESAELCTANPCSQASVDANDSAKTAADISTIAFAVGLIGLGVGAYFWFFAGDSSATRPHSVRVGPGGAAVRF
jgi:hypothetical protein